MTTISIHDTKGHKGREFVGSDENHPVLALEY